MNTQQSQTQPDDLEKKWKKTGSQFLEQNQNQYKSEANLEPLNQYAGPAFQLSFVPDPDIYRNTNQDLPRCQSPPLILQRNKDGNKSPNAGRQSPVHQIIDSNQAQQIRVYPSFGQLPPVTKSIYDQIGSQSTGNFTPLGSPNVSPVIQVNKQASPEYALPQELNILENRHCLCSLSRRIMIRPVQAPDGKLYDFKTLVEFLFKNNWIGPDGKKMELKDLIERKDIQQKIIDYVKKNTDAISAKEVNAEDFQ
ncbi:MAG: hypothetical protein EZS28_019602 [Streblomastix strix]|uniref:U-box domain-containing protein n=1 Tax=Streblomastix strix TaxID=222440 RepID=A0A5J4VR04_9EUKA|nr:MAG: hypothetical protein EZS28_019602 [Streblomastix strix]